MSNFIINIKRANDRSLKCVVKKDGAAQDITGWTVFFTAKDSINDADADAKIIKNINASSPPNDAVNGIFYIPLTHDDTDIDEGRYSCDVKVKDQTGKLQNSDTFVLNIGTRVTDREA